ncbi:MAG TPA: hypothetical protein V6C63_21445 [Allocoleopsis sp.]
MPEIPDWKLEETQKKLNRLLEIEAEEMQQDIEIAESIIGIPESELILANRILENDCIALESRYDMAMEINAALESKMRSLQALAALHEAQTEYLKDRIFWERVLSVLALISILLGAIAAVIL